MLLSKTRLDALRLFAVTLLASALALSAATTNLSAEPALLGVGDSISVSVLNRDELSGAFTVPENGMISLHLIGPVQAAGRSPAEVGVEIEDRYSTSNNLPLSVIVAVERWRPVYVLGEVNQPGAYDFMPGLTVRQALALAGGYFRPRAAESASDLTDAVRMEGEMRVISAEIERFQAEKARLLADVAAMADDAANTGDLATAADGQDMNELDREILSAILSARAAQGEQIRDLQRALDEQIERLGAQIDLRITQISETAEELATVRSLNSRGLAANARVTELSTALNELEAKRLDLEIARLGAEQQRNLAQRDELKLVDEARTDDLMRLHGLDGEIATRQIRLEETRRLHALATAAGLIAPQAGTVALTTSTFRVSRTKGGVQTTFDVEATDVLQPGDTVEFLRSVAP